MIDLGQLLLQLVVILVATRLVGFAIAPLGQPRVIGEMIAGIALGPSLFGAIAPATARAVFPDAGLTALATLSQLGVVLFMFVVGLRLDPTVLRGKARTAVAVSQTSIAIPFVLGATVAVWLHPTLAGTERGPVSLLPFALFIGAAMSVTAFPVLARILAERGLLETKLGAIAIACAAVDDVTAWCILAGVVAVARADDALGAFLMTLAGAGTYAVLLSTIGRRLIERVDHWRHQHKEAISATAVGGAVVFAFASAWITETLGVHALFGAFLAGAVIPKSSGLAGELADRIEAVVTTVFLPVFFAFTGLRTEIGLVTGMTMWAICGLIILIAVAGKLGASAIAARVTGTPWGEAVALGVLLNTRGLMELVVLNVGLELGVISRTLFAMMVLMAVITTCMTSPFLSLALKRSPSLAANVASVPSRSA